MDNKITLSHFSLTPLKIPLTRIIHQSNGDIQELVILVLKLYSKEGVEGQSFIYGLGKYGHTVLIPYIQNELMPQLLNRTFNTPKDVWKDLWTPRRDKVKNGLLLYANALIDIAYWDITAKSENKSLHELLGGNSKAMRVYGSGGWLDLTYEELWHECNEFINQGVSLYKIKIGDRLDEQRIKFLRDSFGSQIQIAVDANQRYELHEAVEKGAMLGNYDITWFEDPLFSDSIFSLKQLSQNIKIPLCIGENFSLRWKFEDVCIIEAVDFLHPDVIRCGGITPFLTIVDVAKKYNKKMVTHLMPELSISLLSLYNSNAVACEFLNLFPEGLFSNHFLIQGGVMQLPKGAGTGVYISSEAESYYKL